MHHVGSQYTEAEVPNGYQFVAQSHLVNLKQPHHGEIYSKICVNLGTDKEQTDKQAEPSASKSRDDPAILEIMRQLTSPGPTMNFQLDPSSTASPAPASASLPRSPSVHSGPPDAGER